MNAAEKKEYTEKFKVYFRSHMDEIIADMKEIMSIDSSFSGSSPGKPFGEGSAKALEWGAQYGRKLGLDVKNFDNYAVSMTCLPCAAHGKDPVLGILSHLDVVPAGDGWNYPPFSCTADGDMLYGRGAIDDKGPSVAVLWAAKAVLELNAPLRKGFRIIFGGGEELGCGDIEYYEQREAFPPMVFTPDGSFPVLNCEKGMLHLHFSAPFEDGCVKVLESGTAVNAVPYKCTAEISADGKTRRIETTGRASHGSLPEKGDNALTKFLERYKTMPVEKNPLLLSLAELFPHGEFHGQSCGLDFSDEASGRTSAALTMLRSGGGRLSGGIDIRFPVTKKLSEIKGIILGKLEEAGFSEDSAEGMEGHYVPDDAPLVSSLLKVYELCSGVRGKTVVCGGATYVHNTEGGVAFGPESEGDENNMHGADERISVQNLELCLNMYAGAIVELCC